MASPAAERSVGHPRLWGVLAGFLVSLFFLFGWFDQSSTTTIELGTVDRLRVESDAGPVEVVVGETARVHRRDSWLFSEPSFEQSSTSAGHVVSVTCQGRFPCRSALTVEVPPGTMLEVVAEGGVVDVISFDGTLAVTTAHQDGVILGPISGQASVASTDGPVFGTSLRLTELQVNSDEGAIDLHFSAPPVMVDIAGGSRAIDLVVPDVLYRLEVGTSHETVEIEVDRATGAQRELLVQSTGPVRIGIGQR